MDKLPKKWCIARNKNNYKVINKWFNENAILHKGIYFDDKNSLCWPELRWPIPVGMCDISDYTYITFEDFKKLVLKQDNMQEYKLTKDKILEMAGESAEVKKSLKKAFPDVFEDEKYLDLAQKEILHANGDSLIETRRTGRYAKKSFYLSTNYNWEIVTDESGYKCLVPTKKQ